MLAGLRGCHWRSSRRDSPASQDGLLATGRTYHAAGVTGRNAEMRLAGGRSLRR